MSDSHLNDAELIHHASSDPEKRWGPTRRLQIPRRKQLARVYSSVKPYEFHGCFKRAAFVFIMENFSTKTENQLEHLVERPVHHPFYTLVVTAPRTVPHCQHARILAPWLSTFQAHCSPTAAILLGTNCNRQTLYVQSMKATSSQRFAQSSSQPRVGKVI